MKTLYPLTILIVAVFESFEYLLRLLLNSADKRLFAHSVHVKGISVLDSVEKSLHGADWKYV